jgi:A/G-specific adenine glycosylase
MSPKGLPIGTRRPPTGRRWYEDPSLLREFRRILLGWFRAKGRTYPWRATRDPFKILVAEIMLQRTRAEQVVPVWEEFFRRFSDIGSLAHVPLHLLRPYFRRLGLMWRTRHFQGLMHKLATEYGGKVPRSREKLLELPCVGEYIADAVLYSAWGEPVVAVDSNVRRVIARILGIEPNPENSHLIRELAQRLLGRSEPAKFNHALLDLAALVCRPRNPNCRSCPVHSFCAFPQPRQKESTRFAEVSEGGG